MKNGSEVTAPLRRKGFHFLRTPVLRDYHLDEKQRDVPGSYLQAAGASF